MKGQISQLVEALQRRTLAIFIGADLPREVTGLPSRAELARELAHRHRLVGQNAILPHSLAEVAQRVARSGNRWEFTAFIRDALDTAGKSPQPFHRRIVELVKKHRIETLITTAYDNLLELAFREAGVPINRVVRGGDVSFINPDRPTLIQLYGDAGQPDTLVVTDRDHSDLLRDRDREPLLDEVRRALRLNTVLFLGYNLADPDFRFLFDQIAESRFARTAYAVWPGLPEADVQMWRDRGIVILDADPLGILDVAPVLYGRGLAVLESQLERTNRYAEFSRLRATLPDDLSVVEQLDRLARDVLGVSLDDLNLGQISPSMQTPATALSLVQKLEVTLTPGAVEPPVQPRLQHLPFNALSWEQFEALCAALVEANPLTLDCHLYGVQGDFQKGIDVVATQRGVAGEETWAYQCKRYQDYAPAKLKEALSKMTYQADYYVLMLSIPAKAVLRQIVEQAPNIFLWDAHDIARKLKNYPALVEDFFGPAWRDAFCGQTR